MYFRLRNSSAFWIVLRFKIGFDTESSRSLGSVNVILYSQIGIKRAARPIFADEAEQPVFDGIPLGSTRWVVTNFDGHPCCIGELL